MREIISDTELHAYFDNQLTVEQAEEFELRLEKDASAQKKLAEYQNIEQSLQQLYQPILSEPTPEYLIDICKKSTQATSSKTFLTSNWMAIAASMVFFVLGSISGWQFKQFSSPTQDQSMSFNLAEPAVFAHSVFSVEKIHPVEVTAEKSQHMNKWLSKRLKTHVKAPDLNKFHFELVGGRLLPSNQQRMAAQFMYQNSQGKRITLYVKKGTWQKTETAITHLNELLANNSYDVSYWIDNSLGYALTSPMELDLSKKISESIYQQMSLDTKNYIALR